MEKPNFKTIKSYSIDYGTRNFIEVAVKKAGEGDEANIFFSISKGYTDMTGNKRYKRSLGFGIDEKVVDFLVDKLKELKKDVPKEKKEAKKEAKKESKK